MRVNDAGLELWSTRCRSVAAELADLEAVDPAALPSGQASAAVVSAARALVDTAGAVLTARVQATAAMASAAAATYAATEDESTAELGALSSAVPEV